MRLRYRSGLLGWMLILSALIFVAPTVEGQSNLPELEQLTVELWPEYDRSDVLVIYRAELSPQTALPAQLAFRLPGYIDGLHAVAVEHNGALFAVEILRRN